MKWLFILSLFSLQVHAQERPCHSSKSSDIEKFFQTMNASLGQTKLEKGFYLTAYNLKIEENCKERMPIKTLESFYRKTMAQGEACLEGLSKFGPEPQKNLSCLKALFDDKKNPPKIFCGGWPFGNDISAVASFPGSSKRHPYLWLSPHISKLYKSDPQELSATIFHEMLHNCGHQHSEGMEIPSTCEECCFNTKLEASKKQSACNVCAGKYASENEVGYAKDILNWSKDYPNWGPTNRMRLIQVGVDNRNLALLKVVIAESELKKIDQEKLVEILLIADVAEKKRRFQDFAREHQLGNHKLPVYQALDRYFKAI